MISRSKLLSWPCLAVPALLAGVIFLGASQADSKSKAPGKPKADKAAPKKTAPTVTEEMKFEEAEALRKAYTLLAAGNHDYDGHRVKAMGAVKDAVRILDDSIMKHGSTKLKAATTKEKAVIAQVDAVVKKSPALTNRRPHPIPNSRKRRKYWRSSVRPWSRTNSKTFSVTWIKPSRRSRLR
ncbi:MAG: hypothetical protein E6K70_25225 [Planctomycetota bacterium]|nr:MAG: hypothetical protein E6K70_25225 [Planctomycetota bacterium]